MNGRRSKERRRVREQGDWELALVQARYYANGSRRLVEWYMRKVRGKPRGWRAAL